MKFFEEVYLESLFTEETAKSYLDYIAPLAGNKKNLRPEEMDSINTKRFNSEYGRGDEIINDYLEGKTVGEFKHQFMKFVQQLRDDNNAPKEEKIRALCTLFNDYVAHFPKFRKYARIAESIISKQ